MQGKVKIHIQAKLRAYTKGIIPDVSDFITDAPKDGSVYARKDGQWVDIDEALNLTTVSTFEGSGLNVTAVGNDYVISERKEDITQLDLPKVLQPDTTYFVMDLTANNYVDGGTAYSEGNNEFIERSEFNITMDGGSSSSHANLFMLPLDSKGVYNGRE